MEDHGRQLPPLSAERSRGARLAEMCPRQRLLRIYTKAPKAFHRSDVDVSLAAAESMARLAHVAGVSVRFYLWPRCPFYNLFSEEGERTLDTLVELGHTIGVHVDSRHGDPEMAAEECIHLMDAGFPGVIDSPAEVSFHMPGEDVLWRDFSWFTSAYASRWEGRYVSDSRGEWDDAKEARVTNDAQVNLHGEHWLPRVLRAVA